MKCENCGSTELLFKVTILSPCGEHQHDEIYCNEHTAARIIEDADCIELIERI